MRLCFVLGSRGAQWPLHCLHSFFFLTSAHHTGVYVLQPNPLDKKKLKDLTKKYKAYIKKASKK